MRIRIRWSSSGKPPRYSPLPFPACAGVRIAQVGDYPTIPSIPCFTVAQWEALLDFQPAVLLGQRDVLLRLSDVAASRRIDFSIDGALFAVTRVGERPLTDAVRDELWRKFGVPVFEIYVAGDGLVMASECEAHHGWHVNLATARMFKLVGEPHVILDRVGNNAQCFQPLGMGFAADVTTEPCECGQTTLRVVNSPTGSVLSEPVAQVERALAQAY